MSDSDLEYLPDDDESDDSVENDSEYDIEDDWMDQIELVVDCGSGKNG